MGPIMSWLEDNLPKTAIMTNGAGNLRHLAAPLPPLPGLCHAGGSRLRLHGLWPARRRGREKPPSPSAKSSASRGDGCFMMHGQEFATAVRYNLPIIVVLVNNGIYGTIRMHQEREYPGRVSGTGHPIPISATMPAPSAAMAKR